MLITAANTVQRKLVGMLMKVMHRPWLGLLMGLLQRLLTQTVQIVLVKMLMRLLHRPLLLFKTKNTH